MNKFTQFYARRTCTTIRDTYMVLQAEYVEMQTVFLLRKDKLDTDRILIIVKLVRL